MKENKIKVLINKPIEEVFEFTTNPKNTHLWIPSVNEEISEEYPPKIGTKYQNRGNGSDWNFYKVVELEKNKVFTLAHLNENYSVRYTYKKLGEGQTEMEYFEWVKTGDVEDPFTQDILDKLKLVIEKE